MFFVLLRSLHCLFSKCTILAIPSFRDRIPVIVDEVTTLVGPGEFIDVIITERGIAINPKRKDLLKAVKHSNLPIKPIKDIYNEVNELCGGKPNKPKTNNPNGNNSKFYKYKSAYNVRLTSFERELVGNGK